MDNHEEYKLNITHHMQVYVDEDANLMDKNKNMESYNNTEMSWDKNKNMGSYNNTEMSCIIRF